MARPRQVTDEQILQTMRECVLKHGPAVSLDLVADQLKVTPPALLKRFGSRRDLMIAALKPPEDTAWLLELAKGPDDRALQVQLEEMIGLLSSIFTEVIPCMIALRESGIPHSELFSNAQPPPQLRGLRALTKWLTQARDKGLVEGDALEAAATAIFGAITTRAFAAHLTQQPWSTRSQREYVGQLAFLFTRALSPTTRSTSRS
jgi:AcrR family transcriptional regulator